MHDDTRKESARERAMRKWRNHQVQRAAMADGPESIKESMKNEPKRNESTKLRIEILKIFNEKNTNILANYMIAINIRRKQLLEEKLRRLRLVESNDE
jgi:hypothetical protein